MNDNTAPALEAATARQQMADRGARHAAITLALTLPGDTVLYLLLPLPAPVVAQAYRGAARVPALARQATWRDIGAGARQLAAGFLFPVLPVTTIYLGAPVALAAASLMLLRKDP